MLPVAILAGGLARRLGGMAERTPKSLVDVAGRPFVAHQLELLRRNGVDDVVLCVGHLGEQIQDAVGNGLAYGVRVGYSFDGQRALGTGGAVRQALPQLGPAFFVLYGDSYLECDYASVAAAFERSGRDGLMTVLRNDDRWDRSNVQYEGDRVVRYDKVNRIPRMHHIDYGLGVFTAGAFDRYPEGSAFDLAAVYQDLIAGDRLAAFEVANRFYEIGTPEGLAETVAHLGAVGV
jgi:N-acetyl-alpha-D-muramate 1-phosphate uridylyltransferase